MNKSKGYMALLATSIFIITACGSGFDNETKAHIAAIEHVKSRLNDPESAKFRNQIGFCGEVNAKNGFGGYVGFKRFIAPNPNIVAIEGDGQMEFLEFDKAWDQGCKKVK